MTRTLRQVIRQILAESSDDSDLLAFATTPVDMKHFIKLMLDAESVYAQPKDFANLFNLSLRNSYNNPAKFARDCLEAYAFLLDYCEKANISMVAFLAEDMLEGLKTVLIKRSLPLDDGDLFFGLFGDYVVKYGSDVLSREDLQNFLKGAGLL